MLLVDLLPVFFSEGGVTVHSASVILTYSTDRSVTGSFVTLRLSVLLAVLLVVDWLGLLMDLRVVDLLLLHLLLLHLSLVDLLLLLLLLFLLQSISG